MDFSPINANITLYQDLQEIMIAQRYACKINSR